MVFFTCNGCGASLKKNQVEKHQKFQCRKSQHLSCVDCMKDFFGEEYQGHIKCLTEEQKYSAKGFVPKPGQNKNEKKQSEWVSMIQDLAAKVGNSDPIITQALQKISQHENVPRKKPKFLNFLKNVLGNRTSAQLCDHLWDLISKALDEQRALKVKEDALKTRNQSTNPEEINGTKRKISEVDTAAPDNNCSNKKKKNENVTEENSSETGDDLGNQQNDPTGDDGTQSAKVKWCTIGKTILRSQDDKELPLKKFQKKIIPEYLSRVGQPVDYTSVEALWAKCLKKLSKNPKFKIHKDRIKLVS